MSDRPLSKPAINAPITITTTTPIATPRIVRAARILWARSDARAMPTPSSMGVIGLLLLAQRRDRVEPCRAAGGVHTGDDAHAAADHHAEHDRGGRYGGGQRRRRVEQHRQADPRHDADRRGDAAA